VIVNAEQVAEGRDLDGTFEQQVSSADLLVLNKIDLVPGRELERIEGALRGIEPEAPLIRAVHCDVDLGLLFPPDAGGLRARRRGEEPTPHTHDRFQATEIQVEAGVVPESLVERLRGLGALRTKGFVETREGLRLVQGVGRRVELKEVEEAPPPELLGRVVVIRRAEG
jgi:G3E family GTPase